MEDGHEDWKEGEKMIRQVDFERSLGDETAPWNRMEKATCGQWGRIHMTAKRHLCDRVQWASQMWGVRVQYRKGLRGTSQQIEGMWKKSKNNFTCSHYESNSECQGRAPGLENKRVIPSPSQLAAHHVVFVHLKCLSLGCCYCAILFSTLQNYIQATLYKYIFKSLRSNQVLCTWCEILSVIHKLLPSNHWDEPLWWLFLGSTCLLEITMIS